MLKCANIVAVWIICQSGKTLVKVNDEIVCDDKRVTKTLALRQIEIEGHLS